MPTNLVATDLEARAGDVSSDEAANGERRLSASSRALLRPHRLHRAPEHERDELRLVHSERLDGAHVAAVAQGRDALGRAQHLVEAMGHVDDRLALGGILAQRVEKAVDLRTRQRCSRFVEDEHTALRAIEVLQGASDHDQRPVRGPQEAGGRVGLRVDVKALEDPPCPLALLPPANAPAAARHEAPADGDVLGHAEHREDGGDLVHEVQADRLRLGRGQRARWQGRAVDHDLAARVRGVDAGEDLDEGRLARPVGPHERVDLATPHVEAHAVERAGARERLADAANTENEVAVA